MPPSLDPLQVEKLIETAIKARSHAYAPYSSFHVGAALLCKDGTIFKGCNVENASYGGAVCAERTAIVKAISEGRRDFVAVAVTTDNKEPVSPCGICRQILREFLPLDAPVLLVPGDYDHRPAATREAGTGGEGPKGGAPSAPTEHGVILETVGGLLPRSFGPEDLGKA